MQFLMLLYSYSNCEEVIPDPVCDNCPIPELGRVRSFGFIRNDFEFSDPTDPTEWTTGIDAGQIFVLPASQGSFDGGTPKTGPGYGNTHLRYISSEYKLTVKEPNYIENCDFWNAMKNSGNFRAFFATETQVHIADENCSISPKAVIEDDDTSEIAWGVEIDWVSKNYPCPTAIPDGIFVCLEA